MEAKVTNKLCSLEDMVVIVDEWEAAQKAEAEGWGRLTGKLWFTMLVR
jgi:hypothetical protein